MKASLGLRLSEAWRSQFEKRPQGYTAKSQNQAVNIKQTDQSSDDVSLGEKQVPNTVKARPAAQLSDSSLGYRDECITVNARLDRKGQYVLVKGTDVLDKNEAKKARKVDALLDPYCLVITRRYNMMGLLESTILEIQSPALCQAIRNVVTYYPDQSFRVGATIKCDDPPKLIYYHRHELAAYKEREDTDERTKRQLDLLLGFLHAHIGNQIEQYEAFLAAGMVKFSHLWMMFKPGTLVYEAETQQLFYLKKGEYAETPCGKVYALECEYVDYDGEKIGTATRVLKINGFGNPREVDFLPFRPLALCAASEDISKKAMARAQRFLQLRGIHNLQHNRKGRVMIDAKTFLRRVVPGDEDRKISQKKGLVINEACKCCCAVCRKEQSETPDDYDHEAREISPNDLLLCSSSVLGFALSTHDWTVLDIDELSEVQWYNDAMNRLVLDSRQKRVLSSLISSPVFTEGLEGDVIGWKGKGLVMLLHGAPGTGKTLTAESVCESLRRPLYIVSGGELGVSPQEVEKSLEQILELSGLWKAVILIDEADVFLEARSAQDIVRNNFVSVFLRRLEYFEGILMLTTNRVEQFDEAFISRIHLALSYPELEPWMRKAIWTNALKLFPSDQVTIDPSSDLDDISKVPLNGRVISYAVRTAKAIADEDKSKLSIEHLWDVVGVQQKFNEHLRLRSGHDEATEPLDSQETSLGQAVSRYGA
ncbi:ATPase family AAA domain-containing protein 3A-like [Pseudocercospora fuligena]|uniref:ATPase family AAA domain-containing protein 3A-like n=1 Tax=Pseudocercospora fuligena TaxID=685502 RepID=A0A8H6VPS7_9PEZI|nr:ATPase family AAA domain-containing protein 3A-like [Pseudocercospora fuligena]